MIGLLLSLYPKMGREQYGEEYKALLEDTGLSMATILDIAKAGCALRATTDERSLRVVAATFLYAFSGIMCIRLGMTENWPIWAPTSPLRAAGLIVTLVPLVYALHVRFTILRERQQRWQGSGAVFWLVASPLALVSTLLLALMCGSLFLSTGLFGLTGNVSFVCGALCLALVSLGLVRLLDFVQGRLLRTLAA